MPPKKMPIKKLSKSGKYFRSHPKQRKKKDAISKKINKRPDQVKKRVELKRKNRQHDKKYGKASRNGKDLAHQKDGSTRYQDSSKNRGKIGEGGRKRKY